MNTPAIPMPGLDADALIRAAREQTGLTDFGTPDVEAPLRRLVGSFVDEAHLSDAGVAGQQLGLLRLLTNRLRFQKKLDEHPEISDEKLRIPIIIIGLPRSGTTKTQRMIAADPSLQWLPMWRMMFPVPLQDARPDASDQRIAMAQAATDFIKSHYPAFQAAHPMGPTEPDEEDFLMEHSFLTSATFSSHRIPGYQAWIQASDPAPFYDLLKLFLQYFQWEDNSAGRNWVLKATCHLHRLRWLLRVFPDAAIVHCHRNPVTSLTSLAEMFYEVRKMGSDRRDPLEVGKFTLDYSRWQIDQYFEQRSALENTHRFIDIGYRDIAERPLDVIEKIYLEAGVELSSEARVAMLQWEKSNPQHKHGRHDYRMEMFGYSEAGLRRDFARYMERFAQFM